MKDRQKGFRLDDETIEKYELLKKKEDLENDADFFKRMLKYTEIHQNQKDNEQNLIHKSVYEELQKKYEKALLKIGELQGELNVYKQIALPKKEKNENKILGFFKRIFTDSERARASEVTETNKDKSN